MKTFLLLAFSFTTALAQQPANPEDQNQVRQPKKQQQAPAKPRTAITQTPRIQPNTTVRQQTPVYHAPHISPVNTNRTPKVRSFAEQDAVRANRLNRNPAPMPRIRPNPSVVTTPQTPTTVPSDVSARNRFDRDNRNRTDRNWQNRISINNNWDEARRRHYREHHDRNWWRSRFSRFALFGSGYYFWDNGYWYPAYGYDPAYNTYAYDEPIYGYGDLDPAQVIANVQTELQRLGYYRYAVDGQMGPATRAAIAAYQRDNGLAITSAIDEPTLQSLGLG
jgi:hypothetical protein